MTRTLAHYAAEQAARPEAALLAEVADTWSEYDEAEAALDDDADAYYDRCRD